MPPKCIDDHMVKSLIDKIGLAEHVAKDIEQYIKERMQEDVEFINFNKQRMKKAYNYPALIEETKAHENATKYGYNPPIKQTGELPEVCACCNLPVNTEELNLDQQTTPNILPDDQKENTQEEKAKEKNAQVKKFKLSAGISMFFSFIKMAICYLMIRFIITDAFNIISSTSAGTYCTNHECALFTSKISSYNKIDEPKLMKTLDILNFITILISIVFFNYYRKQQYRINAFINRTQHTQDDYTLFVQGIPILLIDEHTTYDQQKFDYTKMLKKFFQDKIEIWLSSLKRQKPLQADIKQLIKNIRPSNIVTSISLCFDLSEMEALNNIRSHLMKEHVEYQANMEGKQQPTPQPQEENEKYKKHQYDFLKILLLGQEDILQNQKYAYNKSISFNISHFVGRAFISFEYQHFRDYILREFQRDKNFLKFNSDFTMHARLASTPNDIVWQNMSVEDSTRFKFVLISYFFLMMVLIFAFLGILFMTGLKQQIEENTDTEDDYLGLILTVLITVVTLAINFILGIIVKYLTQFERHQTKSNFLLSHIIKAVITQFLNTAIIYYVSSNMTQSPYLSEEGLVLQVSSLFITSAIIQIATNLINPAALIVTALNWLKYSKKTEAPVFQRDLNKEFERAEFNVVDRYSYYILQIYTCSFYSYLTPIATPCLIVTFVAQYWIDKFNLFKRSSCRNEMDFFLSRSILKIFQVSLFVFALGNLLFSNILHHEQANSVNLIALIIAGVYIVFIMFAPKELEKYFFGCQEKIQQKTYFKCMEEGYFNTQRYWKRNPATKFVQDINLDTKKSIKLSVHRSKLAGKPIPEPQVTSRFTGSQYRRTRQEPDKIELYQSIKDKDVKNRQNQSILARSTIRDSDYI